MTQRQHNLIGWAILFLAIALAIAVAGLLSGAHAQQPPNPPPPPKVPPPYPATRLYPGGAANEAYTDCQNNLWSTDAGYFSSGNATNYVSVEAPPITGATPCDTNQALFQRPRVSNGSTLTLTLEMPPGTYTIDMKYAEIYYTAPGQRVMNILLNNVTWLANFDIFAVTGGKGIAIDEIKNVTVPQSGQNAGQLIITIENVKGGAIYMGVQLTPYIAYSVTLEWADATNTPFGIGYSVEFFQAADLTGTNWNMLATSQTDGTGTATGTMAYDPNLPYIFKLNVFNNQTGLYVTELNSGNTTGITAGMDQAFINQQMATGIKCLLRVNPRNYVLQNILWDAAN
jgi:hypothetical protein